jgi:hypothetical protein
MLESRIPDVVIIDESFWKSCIDEINFQTTLLAHKGLPPEAIPICNDLLATILSDLPASAQRVREAADSGEYVKVIRALRKSSAIVNPSMTERAIETQLKSAVSFAPIILLLRQLLIQSRFNRPVQSITYDSETGNPILHIKREITRFKEKGFRASLGREPRIYVCDASASRPIISQFFEVEQFDEFRLPRKASVVQCYSTRCSTASIVPDKNASPFSRDNAQRRLDDIQGWLNRLAETCGAMLIVGPSAVVGNKRKKIKPLLTCPPNCEFAHYNALRGIDKWKDVDIVVVIGRNQPSTIDVENLTRAIFSHDPEPLALTGGWNEMLTPYRYAGSAGIGKAVTVQSHQDGRVREVLYQVRERESEQAIDRARLIYPNTSKTVYIVSNIPLDIDVDELLAFDVMMRGGNKLELAWDKLATGLLPLNPAWLSASFPKLWKTGESARKGVGRDVDRLIKTGQSSNSISIRGLSVLTYQYRLPGQRNWSKCLSIHSSVESTCEALQKLLGCDVLVREWQG